MKNFIKHMIKPMAIVSCVPSLGLFFYWLTERKILLITSLILYFAVIIGSSIKYFSTTKSTIN